jgi:hypothetical protein
LVRRERGRVLNLVLIGVAVALDPLPLMAFLVVLPSKRGVMKGAAFVFGWLASLVIVPLLGHVPTFDGYGEVVMPGGRIVTSSALQIDESALTGESAPAAKDASTLCWVERTPALAGRR